MLIRAFVGNITKINVECIVNAAKGSLEGGGGVDGAVHAAAGPELLKACRRFAVDENGIRCPTGQAVITKGYDLTTNHIIHTVAPVYKDDSRAAPELLDSCYRESMELAILYNMKSIAFPALGTGIYGNPLTESTIIAVEALQEFWGHDIEVMFICFDKPTLLLYIQVINAVSNGWRCSIVL